MPKTIVGCELYIGRGVLQIDPLMVDYRSFIVCWFGFYHIQ
jgi:hypothetical protein